MITLNPKSYSKLKKYEQHLRTAYYGCSYRGATSQVVQEIVSIAQKCGYNKLVNVTCNGCKLKALQEIGKAYFTYQEKLSVEMSNRRNKKEEEQKYV